MCSRQTSSRLTQQQTPTQGEALSITYCSIKSCFNETKSTLGSITITVLLTSFRTLFGKLASYSLFAPRVIPDKYRSITTRPSSRDPRGHSTLQIAIVLPIIDARTESRIARVIVPRAPLRELDRIERAQLNAGHQALHIRNDLYILDAGESGDIVVRLATNLVGQGRPIHIEGKVSGDVVGVWTRHVWHLRIDYDTVHRAGIGVGLPSGRGSCGGGGFDVSSGR